MEREDQNRRRSEAVREMVETIIERRKKVAEEKLRTVKVVEERKTLEKELTRYEPKAIAKAIALHNAKAGTEPIAKTTFSNFMKSNYKSPPPEAALRWLADYLRCTPAQRLRLLQLAGYASLMAASGATVPPDVQDHLVWHLHVSPWPGFIINQVWDVIDSNAAFNRLMGVDANYLKDSIHEQHRNSLLLIFHEDHPFRHRLSASEDAWQEIAETNIRIFKIHNAESVGEKWYRNRVSELLSINPELRKMWQQVDPMKAFFPKFGVGGGDGSLPMAFYVPFNTKGHPIKEATPAVIEVLPSTYLIGKGPYPCVFTYVPRNEAAIQWFRDIGIMPELVLPEHRPDNGVTR